MITYDVAKRLLSKYQGAGGKCATGPDTDLFVKQVLQYLLLNGTYGNERKFVFRAERGYITLPRELEVPLKVRIDGEVSSVWNRWFEYHSGVDIGDCCLAMDALLEEPNRYPTVYDINTCGMYVGVMGTCYEADDAHIIVKGQDVTGREIYTFHKGEKIVGEYLGIEKGKITRSTVKFAKITGIHKTVTNGYVNLISTDADCLNRNFLSDYDPYETDPAYRRVRIIKRPCPNICAVSILGRIRLKDYYADEDLIPFDNLYLLQVAGQTVNAMYNKDIQTATAQDTYVKGLIETEGNYKKVNNGEPIEVFRPLSGGAVKNARQSRFRWRR